jgi:hypothetical protein
MITTSMGKIINLTTAGSNFKHEVDIKLRYHRQRNFFQCLGIGLDYKPLGISSNNISPKDLLERVKT